jgi:hypothetical protein
VPALPEPGGLGRKCKMLLSPHAVDGLGPNKQIAPAQLKQTIGADVLAFRAQRTFLNASRRSFDLYGMTGQMPRLRAPSRLALASYPYPRWQRIEVATVAGFAARSFTAGAGQGSARST